MLVLFFQKLLLSKEKVLTSDSNDTFLKLDITETYKNEMQPHWTQDLYPLNYYKY